MKIDIQSRGFSLTSALLGYSQQRIQFALSFISGHVNRVAIRLSDVNGPRGGADKCCRIHVTLSGMPDVVLEDTEVDMYAAIDRAVDRAKRTVARKIDRHKTIQKQYKPFEFSEA